MVTVLHWAVLFFATGMLPGGIQGGATWGGFAVGISLGFVFAGMLGVGMHHLALTFFEDWKDRLLLRLWDELHPAADNPEVSSLLSSDPVDIQRGS